MKNSDKKPGSGAGLNILVWRNGKLGNTIAAVPFLLALRQALPESCITVVAESLGAELLACYPEINEIIVYNKRKEHGGFPAHVRFILRLRARKFTHSFHLKRFFRNAFLSFLSGIPERIGFAGDSARRFLTSTAPYREDQNIVLNNLSLLRLIGAELPENQPYRFYSSEDDRKGAGEFLVQNRLREKGYAVIHCGGETTKEDGLPAELFREMAVRLSCDLKLPPVFIRAPGDAAAVSAVVRGLEKSAPFYVFDDPRIRVNAEILRSAALFIGGNSGQAHLAALVATPTVILYADNGKAEFFIRKWLPWQEKVKPVIVDAKQPVISYPAGIMEKIKALIG
jgi:ADP-heptose:LPS heptosyltransferase